MEHKHTFAEKLLNWHKDIERKMPWKNTRDPYKIWLSEVILQQTRVAQGTPYYEKFIAHYPTVTHLADADANEVLKLWEGLGYYSRARNLHATAKYVSKELNAIFPNSYSALLALKGVGEYTAAAIASFAFNLPHAVVDGNVLRVLSRFFAIEEPIDINTTKKKITQLAQALLSENDPAKYNQAIMDFGSMVCTPHLPELDCSHCPLSDQCLGRYKNVQSTLPIKLSKTKVSNLYYTYYVIAHNKQYHIQQRTSTGIWQGLYEFYLIEQMNKAVTKKDKDRVHNELLASLEIDKKDVTLRAIEVVKVHKLSHRSIYASVFLVECRTMPKCKSLNWVDKQTLERCSFPKLLSGVAQGLD
jgi:A/G-specific adenine glycosylase